MEQGTSPFPSYHPTAWPLHYMFSLHSFGLKWKKCEFRNNSKLVSPMSLSKASWVFLGEPFFFHELVHPLHHQIRQPHHPVLPWLPAHTGSEGQRVSLVSMKPPSMTLAPRKCHTNMYIVGPVYIIICIYIFYIQPCVDIFIIYISHILQEVAIAMKQINGITHVGTIL